MVRPISRVAANTDTDTDTVTGLGRAADAERLGQQADDLRERFNAAFLDQDRAVYRIGSGRCTFGVTAPKR